MTMAGLVIYLASRPVTLSAQPFIYSAAGRTMRLHYLLQPSLLCLRVFGLDGLLKKKKSNDSVTFVLLNCLTVICIHLHLIGIQVFV